MEIPLAPGLNALVGLNGAGKSRLLGALGRALSGEGSPGFRSQLLLHVVDGDPDSRTSAYSPRTLVEEEAKVGDAQVPFRESYAKALTQTAVRGARRLQEQILSYPNLSEWDRARFEAFSPEQAVADDPGISSLSAASLLAWVQEGTLSPRLWAAAAVPTEEAHGQYVAGLQKAWDEAKNAYDEQDPYHPDGIESISYEHFGVEFPYTPGEPSPTACTHLPIPLVPLHEPADVQTWPEVLVEDDDEWFDPSDLLKESLSSDEDWAWIMLSSFMQEVAEEDPFTDPDLVNIKTYLEAVPGVPYRWEPPRLEHWSNSATELYRMLYPQATELRCRLRPVRLWTSTERVTWEAMDAASQRWVRLERLSLSARRWARLATFLATNESTELGGYALFDEPEQGLHRAAELQLAQALQRIPRTRSTCLVTATHSPLVAAASDQLIEVIRGLRGEVQTRVIEGEFFERIEALGMLPQDALTTARQVLLVEGPHDRRVVEGLLPETLRATRTLIIPIAGVGDAGAAVNAELLVRFGPRRMIVMVDALGRNAEVAWDRAVEAASDGDLDRARAVIDDIGKRTAETKFLRTAAHELLQAGRLSDCQVVALSVPDVLDLLPPAPFVKGRSWSEIRNAYEEKPRQQTFKTWASRAFNARFDVERIDQAILLMDDLPDDLARLNHALLSS